MDTDARLEQLRDLLYEPSQAHWLQICAALQGLPPDPALPEVAYAREHLDRWPDELRQSEPHWLDQGPPDARLLLVRALHLQAEGGGALAALPFTRHLHTLELQGNDLGDAGAQALAAQPSLASLHTLNLNSTQLSPAGLFALARSPHLQALEDLDLSMNPLTAPAPLPLREAPWRLRRLNLHNCKLSTPSLESVATAPCCASLETLDLSFNDISGYIASFLAYSPRLQHVQHLNLGSTGISTHSGIAVLRALWAPRLQRLHLNNNILASHGAEALRFAAPLPALEHLDLGSNNLGPAACAALLFSLQTPALRSLRLRHNPLQDDGASLLAQWPTLAALESLDVSELNLSAQGLAPLLRALASNPHLRRLDLDGNELGEQAGQVLARSLALAGLDSLNLSSTAVGDVGLAALVASPTQGRLHTLHLGSCGLTVQGVAALLRSPWSQHLTTLDLSGTALGPEGARVLATALPPSLRTLILWECGLDDEQLALLAQGPALAHLQTLELEYNDFSDEALEALRAAPHLRGVQIEPSAQEA